MRTEARVEELAQAQARTEARLETLTARVDTLTARVDTLALRMEELAQAQLRTEHEVTHLRRTVETQLGGLGSTLGDTNGGGFPERYEDHPGRGWLYGETLSGL